MRRLSKAPTRPGKIEPGHCFIVFVSAAFLMAGCGLAVFPAAETKPRTSRPQTAKVPVRLQDAGPGVSSSPDDGPRHVIDHLAFSADGKFLLTGSTYGRVGIWDTQGRKRLRTFPVNQTAPKYTSFRYAFSSDGHLVATAPIDASESNPLPSLWDTGSGKLLRTFERNPGLMEFSCLAFSPDAKTLAGCGYDMVIVPSPTSQSGYEFPKTGYVRSWHVDTGKIKTTFVEGHASTVETVAFSPTGGQLLACSGGKEWAIRSWNTHSAQVEFSFSSPLGDRKLIQAAKWSSDAGRILIQTISYAPMQSRGQNQIFLQNLPGPDALQECAATQGREVLLLYTSQNGRYASAVSGRAPGSTSNEPEILFWDTEKPDAHRSMNREKTDSFNRIAISNDGSMLAAANGKDLLLWNAKTAEFLTTLVDE